MSKKNILMVGLSGLFCCIAVVCILCAVFIKPDNKTLSITASQSISLGVGESKIFNYSCSDSNADVSVIIADNSIVKMEGSKLIGIKDGTTTMRIYATNKSITATKYIPVTVTEIHPVIEIESEEIELTPDDTYILEYKLIPSYISGVSCTVSNPEVCKIEGNKITALNGGKAEIFFCYKDEILGKVKVSVSSNYTTKIKVRSGQITVLDKEILTSDSVFTFSILVLDKEGNEVKDYTRIEVLSSDLEITARPGGIYLVEVSTPGSLEIKIEDLNISEIFTVNFKNT